MDDHLAIVGVETVDGSGGRLARAGYCYARQSDGTPIVSAVIFDEADIDNLLARGSLKDLALHELAHGLGFSDTYWESHSLLDAVSDAHFGGAAAIEAFDSAGGTSYSGEKVPVSSPDYSHWRGSVFGREAMVPSMVVGVSDPLSAVTIQAMADVGYTVDVSLADAYQLPGTAPPRIATDGIGQVFDLSDDVARGPVVFIDADGRIIRVFPGPTGSVPPSLHRQDEERIERWGRDGPGSWVRYPARGRPPDR